ncbi:hypothetical protein DPMN_069322 [Dreissena polymorpha]|uniref:Uncharacterized protein n=1 Tax=Dreissena polymorpha TaxID=45954 RepID=A0A9D3Z3W5_DREPO|nr:hypothetical protein DPMN_069322 [Dreissena polymorpha]
MVDKRRVTEWIERGYPTMGRRQLKEKHGEDLEQFPVYSSVRELLKENLCEKDENEIYYRADCINRKLWHVWCILTEINGRRKIR